VGPNILLKIFLTYVLIGVIPAVAGRELVKARGTFSQDIWQPGLYSKRSPAQYRFRSVFLSKGSAEPYILTQNR